MTLQPKETGSGAFLRQPAGYVAFLPNDLPPGNLQIGDRLQTSLSRADRALGRLDGSIQTLPDPDLFVLMYVRKEAVLSSQIEGTQSSLTDLLDAEAEVFNPESPKDVFEVLNYVRAMNHGLERLHELPVSVRLIKEIHSILLDGVRGQQLDPGEIRRSQNWIGPQGCTLAEASYVPPPAHEVAATLSMLERYLHQTDALPLLIKIGLVHAQFETIHPFLDGNGRVGRLLVTFLLCEKEALSKPVLYLSYYLRAHRERYYDLLQQTRDPGQWEDWLIFFLDGISEVSRQATDTAREIVALREAHRSTIVSQFGRTAGNGLRVLEKLYSQPIISIQTIVDLTGVSFTAASQLMEKFEASGILNEVTGQARYRKYRYTSYIDLFA